MAIKLYVGGLAYSTTDKELEELFASYGNVTSATVIKDRESGRSKGFGFVEMSDLKESQIAIEELNGKEFGGRTITVNQARPQEERRSSNNRPRGGNSFRRQY